MSYQIRTITNKNLLRAYFSQDYALHGFAIGDLAESMWSFSTFTGLFEGDNLTAVSLVWKGAEVPALLVFGASDYLPALIQHCSEDKIFYMLPENVFLTFQTVFAVDDYVERLWRMYVNKSMFTTHHKTDTTPARLTRDDVARLITLYRHGSGPRPDMVRGINENFLEDQVFYGVKNNGNEVIAVSGTHLAMPEENIGVVGYVYTHPDVRGQGYAQSTTSAVIEHLFEMGIEHIILNVREDNHPAIHTYKKIGFLTHSLIVSGFANKIE